MDARDITLARDTRGQRLALLFATMPGYGKSTLLLVILHLADLQRVDISISMSHFELTAQESGLWVIGIRVIRA